MATPHQVVIPDLHLKTPAIDDDHVSSLIQQLRQKLENEPLYHEYYDFCSDEQLHRFLIARQHKLKESHDMTISALRWRKTRLPAGGPASLPDWDSRMDKESKFGSVYVSGSDCYGRPIIAMDDSTRTYTNIEENLTFLAWTLDLACEVMPPSVDKYVAFLNMKRFSVLKSPPFQTCKETMFMLSNGFPERLGHMIIYKPPFALYAMYNTFKVFLDPKTVSKIIFITGNIDGGSQNDKLLTQILGANWRDITNAEAAPSKVKEEVAGYSHAEHWPKVRAMVAAAAERRTLCNQVNKKEDNNLATTSSIPNSSSSASLATDGDGDERPSEVSASRA